MRIKLTTTLAGPVMYRAGQVVDWKDKAEALRLIEAGFAIPIRTNDVGNKESKEVKEKRAIHSNKPSKRRTNKPN
jgi:hypothetical protein